MAVARTGNQPALVIVDAQVGVIADAWDAPRVIKNLARVVERARERRVPIIWVQHENHELRRDSPAWQLVPALVPADGEARIAKRFESSFEETDLEGELARVAASHIILAGAETNWCIRATAYAALERGYDLTLILDGHTAKTIEFQNGLRIEATGIIDDLNLTMTWLNYPGRKSKTATAEGVDFGAPGERR